MPIREWHDDQRVSATAALAGAIDALRVHREQLMHRLLIDRVVVAGATGPTQGVGTLNGQVGFGFMLTGVDADLTPSTPTDLLRIKIWDRATGEVVYDNQMGAVDSADPITASGGGSIVIHR